MTPEEILKQIEDLTSNLRKQLEDSGDRSIEVLYAYKNNGERTIVLHCTSSFIREIHRVHQAD